MPVLLLLVCGCLVNTTLYEQRERELTDDDGDGYSDADGDCDDGDPTVHPTVDEICDGIDQNCSGEPDEDAIDAATWFRDDDGDGYGRADDSMEQCDSPDGYADRDGDCDDTTQGRHADLIEVAYDDVDQDCDGFDLTDVDGDGYDATLIDGDDCDDDAADVHPDANELWANHGVDNDCDGDRYDVVRWTADQAPFRLDGAVAGGELGRRVAFWEEGDCLLASAPYEDGARGALYAVEPTAGTMVAGDSGGTVWGESANSYLTAALSVDSEGRTVVSQPADNGGAGTVFLLDAADLCAGGGGRVDSVAKLTVRGDTPSSWFGVDAHWLDDVDGDGVEELAVAASAHPGGGSHRGAIFLWYDPPFDGASVGVDSADVVLYGAEDDAWLLTTATAADDGGPGTPWLLVGGVAGTAGNPALYRIDGTEMVTGSVADVSDGGLVSWGTEQWMSVFSVGDLDFSGSDEIVAGAWIFGIWDVASLEGFWDEGTSGRELTYDVDGEWMTAVAPVGDYDGDGRDDFALLAEDWPAFTERGQLALVPGERANAGNLEFETMPLYAEGAGAGDSFAYRVDLAGDMDHDGHDELVVAAPGTDNNGSGSGSVYLLPLP